MASNTAIEVPDGFRLHTENTSHILLSANEAFLNPIQEFNRDTSIACIRVWSHELNKTKEERWTKAQQKKATQKRAFTKPKGTLCQRWTRQWLLMRHISDTAVTGPDSSKSKPKDVISSEAEITPEVSGLPEVNSKEPEVYLFLIQSFAFLTSL